MVHAINNTGRRIRQGEIKIEDDRIITHKTSSLLQRLGRVKKLIAGMANVEGVIVKPEVP